MSNYCDKKMIKKCLIFPTLENYETEKPVWTPEKETKTHKINYLCVYGNALGHDENDPSRMNFHSLMWSL